jgi:hypothetical protein
MSTHFYQRHRRVAALLLTASLTGLGLGCQTAKVDYTFRPLSHSTAILTAATAPAAQPSVPLNSVTAAEQLTASRVAQAIEHRKPARPRVARHRTVAVSARQARVVGRVLHQARHVRRSPQAPAEQGLGLAVLGILGLVAAVVGLIGLLLTGGVAWAVVAGVGAALALLAWLVPRAQQ